MKSISLTRGYITEVDDEDAEWLTLYKWHAQACQRGTKFCAAREGCIGDRPGETIFMHREIMHAALDQDVDHIDRDPLNNKRSNLRLCTSQQNSCNREKRIGTICRFKGVYKVKGYNKWRAQIRSNGKIINLGRYDSPIQAAMTYDAAAVYCFREFACINFDEHKEDYLVQSAELDKEEQDAECENS